VIEFVSRPLLRLLRVPAAPHLPAGDPGSARVFRASPQYWTLKLIGWTARQALPLAGFLFLMVMLHQAPGYVARPGKPGIPPLLFAGMVLLAKTLEKIALSLWLVQLPVSFALLRLDYEMRWYIVTDRAARLREGIVTLREMTFTLANVQDIRIGQGPLQRLLGLADVELRTAGGSDGEGEHGGHGQDATRNLHLARFRGVDNAQAIRDLVVDRMKRARTAGLGDPDDAPRPDARPGRSDRDEAARELAAESARLRAALSRLAGA
jgi:PH (Pleckstrin Homology) domain-containing protein